MKSVKKGAVARDDDSVTQPVDIAEDLNDRFANLRKATTHDQ